MEIMFQMVHSCCYINTGKSYVVDEDALGASVETEYTDEDKSGNTTDTKSYKVENVIANVTVKGAFKALGTHKVTYEPVIASGESANGTLTAKADRKADGHLQD